MLDKLLKGYTGFQVLLLLPTFLYQVKDTKSNIGQAFSNTGRRICFQLNNYYFASAIDWGLKYNEYPYCLKPLYVIANLRTIVKKFEEILNESDRTAYSGEIVYGYADDLTVFAKQTDFLQILSVELRKAIHENKANRFNFISHLLLAFGENSPDNKSIYMQMIDFAVDNFDKRSEIENEEIFEKLLDLFWHQDNGLRGLDLEQQQKLNRFLKLAARLNYTVTEDGDEIFFAIKKALDLIDYQKQHGNTEVLVELFSGHFDEKIRRETVERINKNWL